ncbi:MAG: hypothetical protein SNJ60_07875 [Pseudanabaenaceae cyanobacterium]
MNVQGQQHRYPYPNPWRLWSLVVSSSSLAIAQAVGAQSVFPEAGSYSIAPTSISLPAQQFVVYVPDLLQLERVRTVAPDAFINQLSPGQRVVQIGRFNNENFAQRRVEQMRRQGIAALMTPVGAQSPQPIAGSPLPSPSTSIVEPLPGVPIPRPATAPIPVTPNANIEIAREPIRPLTPQPIPTPSPNTIEPVASPPPPRRDRYFAIVPGGSAELLQKARAIAAQARVAASPMGTYIELQGFPDRFSADSLVRTARLQGLDARVIFF